MSYWSVASGDKCEGQGCTKTVFSACMPHEFKGCEKHMAEHERSCIHLSPGLVARESDKLAVERNALEVSAAMKDQRIAELERERAQQVQRADALKEEVRILNAELRLMLARAEKTEGENTRLKEEVERLTAQFADTMAKWKATIIAHDALRDENTRLRGWVERMAVDLERRAKAAEESCGPGCCSGAISEARWQGRAMALGATAAEKRALLGNLAATSDNGTNRQPVGE